MILAHMFECSLNCLRKPHVAMVKCPSWFGFESLILPIQYLGDMLVWSNICSILR
jgi:hypothetical protein